MSRPVARESAEAGGDRRRRLARAASGILRSMAVGVGGLALVEAIDVQLASGASTWSGTDRVLLVFALAGPQALSSVVLVVLELAIFVMLMRAAPGALRALTEHRPRPTPGTLGLIAGAVAFVGLSWVKEHRFELHYITNAYDAVTDVAIIMATLNVALTAAVVLVAIACAAVVRRLASRASEVSRRRWLRGCGIGTSGALTVAGYLLLTREAQFFPLYARQLGGVLLVLSAQGLAWMAWPVDGVLTRRAKLVTAAVFVASIASLRLASPPFFTLRQALIERASHAGSAFELWSDFFDFDRDGAPSFMGGSDCDDWDADIHPLALDVPDDGIDQNCTGADATSRPGVGAVALATTPQLPLHEPWNILWIVIDSLRLDRIGRVVGGRSLTPNLDRLSASAVVFDHARSTSTHTLESVPSMLSGRFPSYLVRRGEHIDPRAMLASQLALHRDYVTAFVTPVHTLPEIAKAGFMVFDDTLSMGNSFLYGSTSQRTTKSVVSLVKPRERPFFIVAHYFDPHDVYITHSDFDFGDAVAERYDSEVAATDQAVGALLEHLAASGLEERTVVVVTADHGEAFGEHGVIGHGRLPYEEVVRVPLVIRVPGVAPRVVTTPVSTIDLMPTMLQLADVPDPGHLQGRSLLPPMTGDSGEAVPSYHEVTTDNGIWRAVVANELKYVFGPKNNIEALYDLNADPHELSNLAASHPQRTEMRALLDAFRDDWLSAAPFAEPLRRP